MKTKGRCDCSINDIMTASREDYNLVIKAAALLESMFETRLQHPAQVLTTISKVLSENNVPASLKTFLLNAQTIIRKSGWRRNKGKQSKPAYVNRQKGFLEQKYPNFRFTPQKASKSTVRYSQGGKRR